MAGTECARCVLAGSDGSSPTGSAARPSFIPDGTKSSPDKCCNYRYYSLNLVKQATCRMKKLLFILIGCVICPAVSAQSLYDLWRKAGKEMVKYSIYYSGTYDFQPGSEFPELKCDEHKGRWSPPLKHRKEYRHVSEEITRSGFDYDRQNDTLLFVFHHRYIWPSWVFVYTKNQQYAYIINARTKEAEKIDKPNRPLGYKNNLY